MESPTVLFVYGTLRHDQPEHGRYCRGLVRWEAARVRGRLYRLVEGYDILVVAPGSVRLRASRDAQADEERRLALGPELLAEAVACSEGGWVQGEVLHLADAVAGWPPLDRWEGTEPGGDSTYARLIVPVQANPSGDEPVWGFAWVYGNTQVPAGAVAIDSET